MRYLLIGALLGATVMTAPLALPAEAAKVVKTTVCHWDDNDNEFDEIRIPTKQLTKGVGHARHEDDVIPAPAEGCEDLPAPEA